ncbi:MAG: tetratricopeptide repeat protein [Litoreibacter sp.]
MSHLKTAVLVISCGVSLAACGDGNDAEVQDALKNINVIDESNLNDIMLTVADPNEAVEFFQRSVRDDPTRIDMQRGLATSLIRAKRATEGAVVWRRVTTHIDATNEDKVDYADALVRTNKWKEAEQTLNSVPPTHETFKRYRLEAVIADSKKQWQKADSFYETAVGLTTRPANVFNNWGYSKLTRGQFGKAEELFGEAIAHDPGLFTAKNNLVIARAKQRNYRLPIIQVTQIEKAQLLHTMALSAVKQGDRTTAESLLRDAIETHPQHFDAAIQALRSLTEEA